MRVLQFISIPEKHHSLAIDSCFYLLNNKNTPTANLAFAMEVLRKMSVVYPDLKNELKITIEKILPNASVGAKNRGLKILKEIK